MKNIIGFALLLLTLTACNNRNIPDVSAIKVSLEVKRFEQDFFQLDTTQLIAGLSKLQQKYPDFLQDYFINILGLTPGNDSMSTELERLQQFLRDYRPIYEATQKTFASMKNTEDELRVSLQFVKYYFPQYKTPQTLITYIGPMNASYEASLGAYSDIISNAGLATGLQLHLGADYSLYHSEMGQALYPVYISRRFIPENISVNAIKNIIDDMYPERRVGKTLIEQMVEKGKRLYVLDQCMPHTADTLKIGYTAAQLKGCFDNEGRIWNFFITNQLLLSKDPGEIKSYISDGPKTVELGEGSPGNMGLFVGWQIVKKYMDKKSELDLSTLLQTDPRKIFEESKYRPK